MTKRNTTTHDEDATRSGLDRAAAKQNAASGEAAAAGNPPEGRNGHRDTPAEQSGPVRAKGAASGTGRSASRSERGATFAQDREHPGETGPESGRDERRHSPKS